MEAIQLITCAMIDGVWDGLYERARVCMSCIVAVVGAAGRVISSAAVVASLLLLSSVLLLLLLFGVVVG